MSDFQALQQWNGRGIQNIRADTNVASWSIYQPFIPHPSCNVGRPNSTITSRSYHWDWAWQAASSCLSIWCATEKSLGARNTAGILCYYFGMSIFNISPSLRRFFSWSIRLTNDNIFSCRFPRLPPPSSSPQADDVPGGLHINIWTLLSGQ